MIDSTYFPPVQLHLMNDPEGHALETQALSRLIFCELDPRVRSTVLREILLKHHRFDTLEAHPQSITDRTPFHFMSNDFRTLTLKDI